MKAKWWVFPAVLLLTGCAGFDPWTGTFAESYQVVGDTPPPLRPMDPEQIEDPQPRDEKASAQGNTTPYYHEGKAYYVMDDSFGFRQRGMAIRYSAFKSGQTASGETYDPMSLTGAHRNLPIPAYVRVRNAENGRTAIVRVNDRGPYDRLDVIELSHAAAEKIGMQDTALIELEVISRVLPPEKAAVVSADSEQSLPAAALGGAEPSVAAEDDTVDTAPVAAASSWFVQVAALSTSESAETLAKQLRDVTEIPVHVEQMQDERNLFRVRIGPFTRQEEAQRVFLLLDHERGQKPLLLEVPSGI